MIAKEVKYHNCCRLKYQKEAEGLSINENTFVQDKIIWQREREVYQKAFESLKYCIKDVITDEQQVLFMKEILSYYQALIHEIGASPSSQKFPEKLEKHMNDEIILAKSIKGNYILQKYDC